MFELIGLVTFILSIIAFLGTKSLRAEMLKEVASLRDEIASLEKRLASGERLATTGEQDVSDGIADVQPATSMPEPEAASEPVELALARSSEEESVETAPAIDDSSAAEEDAAVTPKPKRESFESMLAARWSVWVGGLALAFAGIFAVKYSIEQGLLSPEVRLSLAFLFGLALMAAGEVVRRRTTILVQNTFQNAMIPGILTAAGALTMMGSIYVAHGIYQFIGPAFAFLLLAIVSFATIALSLLHGQALAGLGLIASFVTPALVTSSDPRPWPLFGFLAVAWIGSALASRMRGWRVAPAIANAGLASWAFLYVVSTPDFSAAPPTLALLIMLAGLAYVWPGAGEVRTSADEIPDADGDMQNPETISLLTGRPTRLPSAWEDLIFPRHLASTLVAAIGVAAVAVTMFAPGALGDGLVPYAFAALVLAMGLFGLLRAYAIYPAILAPLAAFGGFRMLTFQTVSGTFTGTEPQTIAAYADSSMAIALALGLGLAFAAMMGMRLVRPALPDRPHALLWWVIGTLAPLGLGAASFFYYGTYRFDLLHAAYALALAVLYVGLAILADRRGTDETRYELLRDGLLAASWAALVFLLIAVTDGMATTLSVAVLGFVYVLVSLKKPWPSLPWAMVLSAIFVAGRIAWEPTIVGAQNLGRTPVFNALLAGYGIPTALLIATAWLIRNRTDARLRNVVEALASLFALLTLAILVRHAMNGGVLTSNTPTLAEQAIYTLLTVGASATLMTLDLRRPSFVFRTLSMAFGYISMVSVLGAHFIGLNPYLTGELTGRIPFFNLLFLAYLLPAIAYGGAAYYARTRRPRHYVIALALTAAALAFAYVTLSVRRFYHGEGIAEWKGFLQPELYTYSVVWLILGVALLVAGYRFRARSLRIASAVLVLISVLKVFLIDLSGLEGLLRVLSLFGLGIVLIGIGRFYQTVLVGLEKETEDRVYPQS